MKKRAPSHALPQEALQGPNAHWSRHVPYLLIAAFTTASLLYAFGTIDASALFLNAIALIAIGTIIALSFTATPTASTHEAGKPSRGVYALLLAAVLILCASRAIPYLQNDMPLGYDSGIYAYAFQAYHQGSIGEQWVADNYEPGLFMLGSFLQNLGMPVAALMLWLYLALEILLLIAVFMTVKELADPLSGALSALLLAVSAIAFKAFAMIYMKNVLGMLLFFAAVHCMLRKRQAAFAFLAILLAVTHKPTFLLLALAYGSWIGVAIARTWIRDRTGNPLDPWKKESLWGIAIACVAGAFYSKKIAFLLAFFGPVLQGQEVSGGLFLDFFAYRSLFFVYIVFLAAGVLLLFREFGNDRRRQENRGDLLVIWLLINLGIVVFRIIFYNRYIIHLNYVLLIAAALGMAWLYRTSAGIGRMLVVASISAVIIASAIAVVADAQAARPLIPPSEWELIASMQGRAGNGTFLVTSSTYAPWALYSGMHVVSPGLLNDRMTKNEWIDFWRSADQETAKRYLSRYDKPLYVFLGRYAQTNPEKFKDCFREVDRTYDGKAVVLEYIC